MIDRVEAAGGAVWNTTALFSAVDPTPAAGRARSIVIHPGGTLVPISALRRWLGDRDVHEFEIRSGFPDDDEKRILDLFPQAEIVKHYPNVDVR